MCEKLPEAYSVCTKAGEVRKEVPQISTACQSHVKGVEGVCFHATHVTCLKNSPCLNAQALKVVSRKNMGEIESLGERQREREAWGWYGLPGMKLRNVGEECHA